MRRYTRALGVSTPSGERIYANISPSVDTVHIEVRYLDVVQADSPPFAQNGMIRFNVVRANYKDALKNLTSYLESLFLRELDKEAVINEDIYTSIGASRKSRRNDRKLEQRGRRALKGEGSSTGLHTGPRRNELTESSGEGTGEDDVASVSDSETNGEDQSGD